MEHDILKTWAIERKITLDGATEQALRKFACMIHAENQKYNLTGLKTIEDITRTLITGSLDPFVSIKVPRGTVFADIGTGAGIPGIPLAVYCRDWRGVLIDSNRKKISFVQGAIREFGLEGCEAVAERIEDLAHGRLRAACEFVFSRAVGELYYALEMAAPLLKRGGLLYVYAHHGPEAVPAPIGAHAQQLGLAVLPRSRFGAFGIREIGIAFEKTGATAGRYPRSVSVIKREMKQVMPSGVSS